jgi:tape measure domain-containing protein
MADLRYSVEVDTGGAVNSLNGLKGALKGVAAAFVIKEVVDFGKQILDSTRQFQQYTNQLKLITKGSEDLNRVMALLTQEAINNRTSFGATVDLFTKLRVSTEALGISEQRVVNVTGKLSQALQVAGADAATTNSVVRQFGQAMASGTVRGDEFNSLVEGLGPALAIMARETGLNVGELRKLSQEGKLSAEVMFQMLENSRALGVAFGQMEPTISSLETQFGDSFDRMLVKMGQLTGATQTYQRFLKDLTREFDKFSGAQGAMANKPLGNIFSEVQKGAISTNDAVEELEQRLRNLRGSPISKLINPDRGSREDIERLLETLRQKQKVDKQLADQAAKDLQADAEKQAALNGILKPYRELIDLAEQYAKKEYGSQREKLNKEIAETTKVITGLKQAYAASGGQLNNYTKLLGAAEGKLKDARRELNELNKQAFASDFARKEANAIADVISAYKYRNEEVRKGLEFSIDSIRLSQQDQQLTQTSIRDQQVMLAGFEAEKNLTQQINSLKDKATKYARGTAEEKAQVDALYQAVDQLKQIYTAHVEQVKELTDAYLTAQEARQLNLFSIKEQIALEEKILDIQHEMATMTMSEIEKKYADIDYAAQKSARAAIAAEEARRGAKLSPLEAVEYYEAAMKGSDRLKQKTKELNDQSREFSTGWRRAFRQYADDAANAAKRAENLFRRATQGMEDLIVNFAKTGKFEWKTFVASMLEELLRSQIQVIFASLMGAMGDTMKSAGGGLLDSVMGIFGAKRGDGGIMDTILGGIGSIFGMGGGGTNVGQNPSNPMYVYDISGGGGGGGGVLESVAGGTQGTMGGVVGKVWEGVKSAAGSVWEGIKSVGSGVINAVGSLGGKVWEGIKSVGSSVISTVGNVVGSVFGGSGGSGIWDTIKSVGSAIGNFFGGFFANGGTLGAGKWGIAGERGPEIIRGPATITPMGGSTMVTYNINAVDAMSFKTLLAQDPSFIYGLTLQGSKGIAARR